MPKQKEANVGKNQSAAPAPSSTREADAAFLRLAGFNMVSDAPPDNPTAMTSQAQITTLGEVSGEAEDQKPYEEESEISEAVKSPRTGVRGRRPKEKPTNPDERLYRMSVYVTPLLRKALGERQNYDPLPGGLSEHIRRAMADYLKDDIRHVQSDPRFKTKKGRR